MYAFWNFPLPLPHPTIPTLIASASKKALIASHQLSAHAERPQAEKDA
jgi:hypothetical protein